MKRICGESGETIFDQSATVPGENEIYHHNVRDIDDLIMKMLDLLSVARERERKQEKQERW